MVPALQRNLVEAAVFLHIGSRYHEVELRAFHHLVDMWIAIGHIELLCAVPGAVVFDVAYAHQFNIRRLGKMGQVLARNAAATNKCHFDFFLTCCFRQALEIGDKHGGSRQGCIL